MQNDEMIASQGSIHDDIERGLGLCMAGQWTQFHAFVRSHAKAQAIPWMVARQAMAKDAPNIAQKSIEFALQSELWDPPAMRELASCLVSLGQFDVAADLTQQAEKVDAQRTQASANGPSLAEALAPISAQLDHIAKTLSSLQAQIPVPSRKHLSVVLLVQSPVYWNTWSELLGLMQRDTRFEVSVVLADLMEGARAAYECSSREFLIQRDVDFVHVDHYDLEMARPDLVIYQSPYPSVIHPKFDLDRVRSLGARIVYTPYCVDMCGGKFLEHANFQSDLVTKAWRVYARSKRQKAEFARLCPAGNQHVSVVGAPKLDALANHEAQELAREVKRFAQGRKIVLYNAHFRIHADGGGYSTYPVWEPRLRELLAQRDDFVLLFRPHPNFFGYLRDNKILSAQGVNKLIAQYEKSDRIFLDQSFDYRDAMHVSDLMVSDASSLLLEFSSLGKPVVYFRNDRGPGLNHDGDFADCLYQPESVEELSAQLDQLFAGQDHLEAKRNAMVRELLFTPPQGCSQAILEDLAGLISKR